MIEVNKLTKSYGDFTALNNFSISIPKGSIYGILGPNGAGKTTFLRILNQIMPPTSGGITWDGETLNRDHLVKIGYLPEERGLYKEMKVDDQLIYLAQLRGLTAADAKEKMNFWFDRLNVEGWGGKKLRDLSKGMAQKIQFVSTVLHDPELLILDEPFSGFDPINANLIRDEIIRLNKEGATVLFSTHRMESVEDLCSNICLIHQSNKILDGNKQEVKNQFRTKEYVLEVSHPEPLRFDEPIELISLEEKDNIQRYHLGLKALESPFELLKTLPESIDFYGFRENIPSMNDIFINAIQQTQNHE
ncbi:MAG: ABC transporter ATP-binding protein [Flavobacteriales bacterium]